MGCNNSKVEINTQVVQQIKDAIEEGKENYIDAQNVLSLIMNNYYSNSIKDNKNKDNKKYVVVIGQAGKGKSTLAKVVYGVDESLLTIASGGGDGTKSVMGPYETKFENLYLFDVVGFNPDPFNLSKLLVILLSKGIFPDFFAIPGERTKDMLSMNKVLMLGVADVLFVPFQPAIYYYSIKKNNKTEVATDDSLNYEQYGKESSDYQFHNVEYYKHSKENNPIYRNQKMKANFIELFFNNDKFIEYPYIDIQKCLLNLKIDPSKQETQFNADEAKMMFYYALVNSIQQIPKGGVEIKDNNINININNQIKYFESNQ